MISTEKYLYLITPFWRVNICVYRAHARNFILLKFAQKTSSFFSSRKNFIFSEFVRKIILVKIFTTTAFVLKLIMVTGTTIIYKKCEFREGLDLLQIPFVLARGVFVSFLWTSANEKLSSSERLTLNENHSIIHRYKIRKRSDKTMSLLGPYDRIFYHHRPKHFSFSKLF